MGIKGLLPALKPIIQSVHLSQLSHQTCGIDVACLLHRGAYGSAIELLHNDCSDQIISFVFKVLSKLAKNKIQFILVFDGDRLPLKSSEEQSRLSSREQSRELAIQTYSNQNTCFKHAAKAITITNAMVTSLIAKLNSQSVPFIVAPFEGIIL